MTFGEFTSYLHKIKNSPLSGEEAHLKMAPKMRMELIRKRMKENTPVREAAVLMLIHPDANGEAVFPLILRKTYPGIHSSQICFPGGKRETGDRDFQHTALREMNEEIGIDATTVKIIKELTPIYIPPSNFKVYSFLSIRDKPVYEYSLQEEEVEQVIPVGLSEFTDDSRIITERLSTSYAENIEVSTFRLANFTVWGATAMILSEIKLLFQESGLR